MIDPCACLTHVLELLQKQEVIAAELGPEEERGAVACKPGRGQTALKKSDVKPEWPSEAKR